MKSAGRNAALVAMSVLLILIGLVASFSLPPTFLLGAASQPRTQTVIPDGSLDVTVTLQNGTGVFAPIVGLGVGITQLISHGLRAILTTDRSGNVSIPAAPGVYGIGISDPRFTLGTSATVFAGKATRVSVLVNRTSLYADFAQVQDSTAQEQIGPWDQVVVEVSPSGVFYFSGLWNLVGPPYVVIPGQSSNVSLPRPGGEVFLQPLKFSGGPFISFSQYGPEVPADVVAKTPGANQVWLTLRPLGILVMTGSYYLSIVTYAAGSSVVVTNA